MFSLASQPIIQEIKLDKETAGVGLFIKREDLIHPVIAGNKWRKLKFNLEQAKKEGQTRLLTFGGAYSNHIHATAGAAREYGFDSIGVIRGEEHLPLNPTLRQAEAMGMQLFYLDRSTYREKQSAKVVKDLHDLFGSFYLIPEGGTNVLALKGASEIVSGLENDFDYFVVPVGTGGTLAGIINGMQNRSKVIGFSVLKGGFLNNDVNELLTRINQKALNNWEINDDYHFGGYAKFNQELVNFINAFKQAHKVPLDPVYTGKMMFGVADLIQNGFFPPGSRILAIHTGGLQGIRGFNERFGKLIDM